MIEYALFALGAVLVFEGLVYLLAPSFIEDMLDAMRSLSIPARRIIGALVLVTGLIILRLVA